jgi:hypothetical protein
MVANPYPTVGRIGYGQAVVNTAYLHLKKAQTVSVKKGNVGRCGAEGTKGGGNKFLAVDFEKPITISFYNS